MDDPIDSTLLLRYAAGECSPAEYAEITRQLEAAGQRGYAESLRDIARMTMEGGESLESSAAWTQLQTRLARGPLVSAPARATPRTWYRRLSVMALAGVAAVVLAAIGITVASMLVRPSSQTFREFVTPAGSRTTITLRDGTRLVLAPATRLRVPADFGRRTRTVDLEGEAYFAVVHDVAHPFTVRTHGAVTRDVGTAFDVRAYPEDSGARVAVAEGEVTVGRSEDGRVGDAPLRMGDMAMVTDRGVTITRHVDIAEMTAWMQGGLTFHNTRLGDAVREVARAFDLSVTIADSGLANQLVTATFGRESVDEVLDEVTAVVGARYERMGQRVVIRRRRAGGRTGAPSVPASGARTPLQTAGRDNAH